MAVFYSLLAANYKKSRRLLTAGFPGTKLLQGQDIDSAKLAAALGIRLDVICDRLTLVQGFKTVASNRGEMYENIVAAFSVGDKTKALL
jgi:hypothetical protein